MPGLDAHLLTHYFDATDPRGLHRRAEGRDHRLSRACRRFIDAANQSQRTDPVPSRADIEGYQLGAVERRRAGGAALRSGRPIPTGARPTVFDVARNIYGVNPQTGAALRPFDNVGVQYGLNALNSGAITVAAVPRPEREDRRRTTRTPTTSPARTRRRRRRDQARVSERPDCSAAAAACRRFPIFDNATSNEDGGYHYGWFHFALRERIRQANGGNSDNMVMWRSISAPAAKKLFDDWMVARTAGHVRAIAAACKVLRAKPAERRRRLLRHVHAAEVHRRDAAVHQQADDSKCSSALSGVLEHAP